MKKIISYVLTGLLAFSLVTFGLTSVNNDNTVKAASDSKTLVVYFSASGNTKAVAEKVADAANADIFEVTPTDPYTSEDLDWNDDDSRVNQEHEDESLQDVELTTTTVDNWDSYDTILIGFPIWWGNPAWPINGFVKANDFSGKTVIPFCTSYSSDIGSSSKTLKALTGTGKWKKGHRFSEDASKKSVRKWVKSLDLK